MSPDADSASRPIASIIGAGSSVSVGTQEFYRAFSLVNGGRKEEHDLFEGIYLPTMSMLTVDVVH